MCGICGILNLNQERADKHILENMTAKLVHRGPDEGGIFVKDEVGLGHRRLSIIDLQTGNQPIYSEDKNIVLVFNGEIYNFRELRKNLEQKGHVFLSQGDAETIVHLYEDYQEGCLDYLRGMFAFALWDVKEKKLFLARDRMGKKPAVYWWNDKRFLFASELQSLLEAPYVQREIDSESLNLYLSFFYVPAPWTMFKNIRKLPAAHYLVLKDGKLKIKKYWTLSAVPSNKSFSDYKEGLAAHLEEAVRLRMISDVPLGAFLSGGIDSSIIVSLMSKYSQGPVKTFSVGSKNQLYNELSFARIIAEKFHTEHKELIVEPKAIDLLPEIIRHYGEPFADYSCIPTFYLSRFARQSVKTVLNGDGGDESFAGYDRYTACEIAEELNMLPGFLVKIINYFVEKMPPGNDIKTANWQLKRFFKSLAYEPRERYLRWISAFNPEEKTGLYRSDFANSINFDEGYELFKNYISGRENANFSEEACNLDIQTYLPYDLLVKMDIATMASSLEARSPFLDHKFMEFAAQIPFDLKLKNYNNKHILKQAFKGKIPQAILKRKKQGFSVPIGQWFRGELKNFMLDVLLDSATQKQYFKRSFIQGMIDEHLSSKVDNGYKIWTLLIFELWHREFIAG